MYQKPIPVFLRLFPAMLAALIATALLPLLRGTTPLAIAASCGKWQIISSPNTSLQWNQLNSVAAISATDVWAVGRSSPDGGNNNQTLTEHWNGNQWTIVASPNDGNGGSQLTGVSAVSTNDVWAVGYSYFGAPSYLTLIEHWDGSSWSVISSPNPGTASDSLYGVVALASNNVWAVGSFNSPGIPDQTLIEHWDGTSWSVLNSPSPGTSNDVLYAVTAISTNDIWTAGYLSAPGQQTLIEHWDGTSWSVVPSPNKGLGSNYLTGIAADPGTGEVWSVGSYQSSRYQHLRTLIEYWNGKRWKFVVSPNVGTFDNILNSVTDVSTNNVWAVGYYISSQQNFPRQTLVERWNGTKWNVVKSPNAGKQFSNYHDFFNGSTSVPGTTQMWAVGYYIAPPPDAYTLTEYYC
jgi:hypothetical protein